MALQLQHQLHEMARDIRAFGKDVERAHRSAVARTAYSIRDAETAAIQSVFDRPTPYAQRSPVVLLRRTGPNDAEVRIKDTGTAGARAANFLSAQIDGGERRLKRFEVALQKAGILPPGMFVRPGKFARLDAYGNLSTGQITQILSQLRAFAAGGKGRRQNLASPDGTVKTAKKIRASLTRQGGQYIAVTEKDKSRRPLGVYQVANRSATGPNTPPRNVLLFIKSPRYTARLDFQGIAEKVAQATYDGHLSAALQQTSTGR